MGCVEYMVTSQVAQATMGRQIWRTDRRKETWVTYGEVTGKRAV
jgi:hypothetical protein